MFMKVFGIGAPVVLGSLYMTGNLGSVSGQAYDRPATEVYASLSTMSMPDDLQKQMNRKPVTFVSVDRVPDKQVRWKFTRDGHQVFSVTADISPLSDGRAANVSTKVEAGELDLKRGGGVLPGMAGVMVEEQIAAVIERRPYDEALAGRRAAVYMVKNQGQMFDDVNKQMAGASERFKEYDRESARSAATRDVRFQPGKPMMDVSR